MIYCLGINYILYALFARFLLCLTVTVVNKIFITKNPSVIKTEGDSKGINIAEKMLIHFCHFVLTNCAMCSMLNIIFHIIYRYNPLKMIKNDKFIIIFKPFIDKATSWLRCIVKLNYSL